MSPKLLQPHVGRRLEHEIAQDARETTDLGLIGRIAGSVRSAEFCDLALGAALTGKEVAPVRQRQKILRAAFDNTQTVLVQLEVADDLRLQQTHGVGRRRVAKAGMEFLRDGCAPDHAAPLNQAHAQSRHAEIGRANEPVVTGSDYDGIEIGHSWSGWLAHWRRAPYPN